MRINEKIVNSLAIHLAGEHCFRIIYLDLTADEYAPVTIDRHGILAQPSNKVSSGIHCWISELADKTLCHENDRERLISFADPENLRAACQHGGSGIQRIVFRRKLNPSDPVFSVIALEILLTQEEDGHIIAVAFLRNVSEGMKNNNIALAEGNTLRESPSVKRTVLAIEDNEINMEMLTEILSEDYNVLQAENGKAGLEVLQEHLYDISVILLDVQMPVMNGYEFLSIVKNDPLLSEIPIIVATGMNDLEEEKKCLLLGANDFVTKPYNMDIIRSRVASIIRLKESVATLNLLQVDDHTGLYTLRAFYHYARLSLDRNPGTPFSMYIFDISRYNAILEMYGEEEANNLLRRVATIMRGYPAAADIFGRFGAAKFLLIKDTPSREEADEWTESMLERMTEVCGITGVHIKAGIYQIEDRTLPISVMCEHAATALNSLVNDYENAFSYYDAQHAEKEKRLAKLEADMHKAYETEQFSVFYQPKHDVKTGALVGAEALIRWIHPEYGFLSPAEFIPLFEQNGFIAYADYYVWRRTCRNLRDWIKDGVSVVPVSVNASKRDFGYEMFAERCLEPIREYGLDPSLLHIEVTETLFSDRLDEICRMLSECREGGIEIELDDFGSGYSTLNSLALLPLDVIKMDRAFLRNISDEKWVNVLGTCIKLAKSLNLKTVCEGVEDEQQLNLLRQLDCDRVQGYYYSKPLSEKDFLSYMKKYAERTE